MAWEQDYHLQDPGRLALFDEYLEMGRYHNNRNLALVLPKSTIYPLNFYFRVESIWPIIHIFANFSATVRIRHIVCSCIPIGTTFRAIKQYCRDSIGCIQNGNASKKTIT